MERELNALSAAALADMETESRVRLEQRPEDTRARLNLAWSLFLLALVQLGRESSAETDPQPTIQALPLEALPPGDRSSRQLVQDCARQVLTARRLADSHDDVHDADRLTTFVELSCDSAVVVTATQDVLRAETRLATELLTPPEGN